MPRPGALARNDFRSVEADGLYSTIWRVLDAALTHSLRAYNLQSDHTIITAGCQQARICRTPGYCVASRSMSLQLGD